MARDTRSEQERILREHLAQVEDKAHQAIRELECPEHRWSPRIRATEMGIRVIDPCCRKFEQDVMGKIASVFPTNA